MGCLPEGRILRPCQCRVEAPGWQRPPVYQAGCTLVREHGRVHLLQPTRHPSSSRREPAAAPCRRSSSNVRLFMTLGSKWCSLKAAWCLQLKAFSLGTSNTVEASCQTHLLCRVTRCICMATLNHSRSTRRCSSSLLCHSSARRMRCLARRLMKVKWHQPRNARCSRPRVRVRCLERSYAASVLGV